MCPLFGQAESGSVVPTDPVQFQRGADNPEGFRQVRIEGAGGGPPYEYTGLQEGRNEASLYVRGATIRAKSSCSSLTLMARPLRSPCHAEEGAPKRRSEVSRLFGTCSAL
jgi:hypothetical protein